MMHRPRASARLTVFGLNASGFVMLLSLPGLWVAWEPWVLWAVAGIGVGAGGLHCGLLWLEPPPEGRPPEPVASGHPRSLRVVRDAQAAAMAAVRHPAGQWLVRFGLNTTGLVMLLSFPATWIAWIPGSLWIVAAAGLSSACLHCALLWLEDEPAGDGEPNPGKVVPVLNVAHWRHDHAEQERAA